MVMCRVDRDVPRFTCHDDFRFRFSLFTEGVYLYCADVYLLVRNEVFALCVKYCYLSRSSFNSVCCMLKCNRIILESFKVWDCETVFRSLFFIFMVVCLFRFENFGLL